MAKDAVFVSIRKDAIDFVLVVSTQRLGTSTAGKSLPIRNSTI